MITDLQNKVKELENKIEQKDHQIKELQNDLSVIYELFLPDILEKSYKKVTYYIPIKKAWEMIENNKEWILRDSPNGYIKVKVDSVYKDWSSCYPINLFNGNIIENTNDYGWASNPSLPACIQIEFQNPLVVNIISMTSRTNPSYVGQSPRTFNVYGKNKDGEFQIIGSFKDEKWNVTENKLFRLYNSTPFNFYKIEFTETMGQTDVSFVELNLGYIKFNQ